MRITETIDMDKHLDSWNNRFNQEVSYLGGKDMAFSPGVQAQISPGAVAALGEMPLYHAIHGIYVGWEYTNWVDECNSISESCYIGDWSWLSKVTIKGPDVIKCLENSTINGYKDFPIGKGRHIISIRPDGKMIGDGIAFRISEDEVLCTGGLTISENQAIKTEGLNVECKEVSADKYIYHIQGPNSKLALEKVIDGSLDELQFGHFKEYKIEGRDVTIYRGGMSGEIGYEVMGPSKDGSVIWKAILDSGKELGIRQLGFRSLMANHLQAFFPTIWVDYTPAILPPDIEKFMFQTYRSPVDFGWENRIAKDRDFPGKEVLLEEIRSPKNKSVTLEWNDEDCVKIFSSLFDKDREPLEQMPMPVNTSETSSPFGYTIINSKGEVLGITTNRGYSTQFRKFISLAYLNIDYSEEGKEVYILYGTEGKRQEKIRAVVKSVPYKKDVRRN